MRKKPNSVKTSILLHDDWEIYGDGTGDPNDLMFKPAQRILNICDKYEAKYTFNAEVGQQLHMLNAPENKWQTIAREWEDIMKDAISRGHDVQLHLHPQWIGAKLKNNAWQLDYSQWSSGKVEHNALEKWIREGKEYLENLLQEVDPNYKVVSFRAGGWLCQPSLGLYKALKKNGIVCDTSVSKGRFVKYKDCSYVDFRDAVSRYEPWEVKPNNFAQKSPGSGVYELPVYAEETALPNSAYLLKHAFRPWYYMKILKYLNSIPEQYSPTVLESGKTKAHYGSFGFMHHEHLISFLNKVSAHTFSKGVPPYLIYVTHSKDFIDYSNFETFLAKLSNRNDVEFSTTRKFVNNYVGN